MKSAAYLLALIVLFVGRPATSDPVPRRPPNIISIVADDQGLWTMGCYGNRDSRTPNMDRLAREGARFTNAFVATPVCSPSRVAFLTGRYGTEVGITDYIRPEEAAEGIGLPDSARTWPSVLQKAGYRTGLFGKWHLGEKPKFHPTKRGFDVFSGFLQGGRPTMNAPLEVDGVVRSVPGATADVVTDFALKFIGESRDKPFACLVHFHKPHLPYAPVLDVDKAPFNGVDPKVPMESGLDIPQLKQLTLDYYASIHSVDRNLGRILAKLEELGIADNTVVLFTSDHGYNLGHHRIHTKGNGFWMTGGVNGPKRPNLWDTSIRTPLLVRWPGRVKAGLVVDAVTVNLDTGRTLLGLMGVPFPHDTGNHGRDMSPLLLGGRAEERDVLFLQYDLHNDGLDYMRGIRTAKWKLVKHLRSHGMDELYDLEADPGETRNLYNDATARPARNQLEQRLAAEMRAIRDPLLREFEADLKRDAAHQPQ